MILVDRSTSLPCQVHVSVVQIMTGLGSLLVAGESGPVNAIEPISSVIILPPADVDQALSLSKMESLYTASKKIKLTQEQQKRRKLRRRNK